MQTSRIARCSCCLNPWLIVSSVRCSAQRNARVSLQATLFSCNSPRSGVYPKLKIYAYLQYYDLLFTNKWYLSSHIDDWEHREHIRTTDRKIYISFQKRKKENTSGQIEKQQTSVVISSGPAALITSRESAKTEIYAQTRLSVRQTFGILFRDSRVTKCRGVEKNAK